MSAGSISATQLINQLPEPTISASPITERMLAEARPLSMLTRAMMMQIEPHRPSRFEDASDGVAVAEAVDDLRSGEEPADGAD